MVMGEGVTLSQEFGIPGELDISSRPLGGADSGEGVTLSQEFRIPGDLDISSRPLGGADSGER